ncbi:MAG: hypothetical protein ABIH11_04880 [Candidatus Altiarchaeota archaeon]
MIIAPFIISAGIGVLYGSRIRFKGSGSALAVLSLTMALLVKDYPYYGQHPFSGIILSALAGLALGSMIRRGR